MNGRWNLEGLVDRINGIWRSGGLDCITASMALLCFGYKTKTEYSSSQGHEGMNKSLNLPVVS
jgi:hypothetical protein